ncbi:MAG: hypothetical protein E7157_01760 [Lactobacillales bacterium]|nr:hypothetical protein [Lactobacillales bacterium]
MKSGIIKTRIMLIIMFFISICGIIYLVYGDNITDLTCSLVFLIISISFVFLCESLRRYTNGVYGIKGIIKLFTTSVIDDEIIDNYIKESLSLDEVLYYIENGNIENLKIETFEIYKNIENACNNNNLDELRNYVTDEFYNLLIAQINLLKTKNQQKIVEGIEYIDSYLINAFKEDNKIYFDMDISLESKEYIKNINTNEIVDSSQNKKDFNHYKMTFVKSIENKEKICPNCGSKIIGEATNNCNYCNTRVIIDEHKLVLSKIVLLGKNKILK